MPKLRANLSMPLRLSLLGNKAESRVYPGKNNTTGKPRTIRIMLFGKKVIITKSMAVRIFRA
jgi:hypothetical protein